jgi:hypothetical protein
MSVFCERKGLLGRDAGRGRKPLNAQKTSSRTKYNNIFSISNYFHKLNFKIQIWKSEVSTQ